MELKESNDRLRPVLQEAGGGQGVHLNLEHEPGERPQGLQRQGVEMTGLTERTKRLD